MALVGGAPASARVSLRQLVLAQGAASWGIDGCGAARAGGLRRATYALARSPQAFGGEDHPFDLLRLVIFGAPVQAALTDGGPSTTQAAPAALDPRVGGTARGVLVKARQRGDPMDKAPFVVAAILSAARVADGPARRLGHIEFVVLERYGGVSITPSEPGLDAPAATPPETSDAGTLQR